MVKKILAISFDEELGRFDIDINQPPLSIEGVKERRAIEKSRNQLKLGISFGLITFTILLFALGSAVETDSVILKSLLWPLLICGIYASSLSIITSIIHRNLINEYLGEEESSNYNEIKTWLEDPEVASFCREVGKEGRELIKAESIALRKHWVRMRNLKSEQATEEQNQKARQEIYFG